jgi:hypothetical protein
MNLNQRFKVRKSPLELMLPSQLATSGTPVAEDTEGAAGGEISLDVESVGTAAWMDRGRWADPDAR